jgi:hypothetical protein
MAEENKEKVVAKTSKDETLAIKAVFHEKQPEIVDEPRAVILSPNSPWKKVHVDGVIDTFVMEIRDAGILIRTESPARGSESTVFLPNVKASQIPSCQ